ncbi:hypothetical protein [Mycoplasma elephantis]|uniref:hypothetical protein n=1 Tax=Mycoplasma elephantis TaxID=114882 RepID=UPI00048393C6|nr:hypothetical protein [Mycoplasma elephantis]
MKTKKIKLVCYWLIFVGFIIVFASIIGLKTRFPYKPGFYNYASYISLENRKKLDKTFDYKEFAVLDEFSDALTREKAIAGVGTDHQVVSLIKQDRLKKIDYNHLFGMDTPKNLISENIWTQLESYDKYLLTDWNGKPFSEPRHLWEYFIPYYAQDFVIAYNHAKNNNKHISVDTHDSYFEILTKLAEQDYKKLFILNDFRILLAIGTSRMIQDDNTYKDMFYSSDCDGYVTDDNYKKQIKSFINMIEDSTKFKINDGKHIIFDGNGQEVLRSLIDPNSDVDMAILFNGDALDAYYSEDNISSVPKGSITIIKPRNNVMAIDGVIINKNASDKEYKNYLDVFNDCFFKGYKEHTKFDTNGNYDKEASLKSLYDASLKNGEIDYESYPFLSNFDLINYTPVYKVEYDFHQKYYFDDDKMALGIYALNKPVYVGIRPIDKKLHSKIITDFNIIIKG